jgi:hypothetical protein
MKIDNIRVGMVLKLKPQRQADYGRDSALVTVTALKPHKTYKRTWVVSGDEFYQTSDFEGSLTGTERMLTGI